MRVYVYEYEFYLLMYRN